MNAATTASREPGPLAPPIEQLYTTFSGARVYFDELPGGNNGDQLIIRGSQHMHSAFGFISVDRPDDAEVIIVRGNGVLTDFYAHTPHRARIQAYIDGFPTATFVLEPSTLSFVSEPALRVPTREAPVYLYARDRLSYVSEGRKAGYRGCPVSFGLDHDMAFRLSGSPLIEKLTHDRAPRHNLIVERYDIERPSRGLKRRPARAAVSRFLPAALKDLLRPHLARSRAALGRAFQHEAESLLRTGTWSGLPTISGDLSNSRLFPFDEFLASIRDSGTVVTQRLHVGVLSALLGVETWLDDRGYYKIPAIWEQSMSSMPHVHLLSTAVSRKASGA